MIFQGQKMAEIFNPLLTDHTKIGRRPLIKFRQPLCNYHSDLVCYVHIHSLPHLNVCEPFLASNGWPRVASGLRRALYRVSYLARMGSWRTSVSLVTGRSAHASVRKATWIMCLASKKTNIFASDGIVGDRSFFGLEGGAICQALEQKQNPRMSDRRVCGEGSRRWGT